MKVIAKVSGNVVICEVSDEELALLNGFRSKYDEGCRIQELMNVGAECNLAKMANTSRYIRSMNKDTLKNAREKLEDSMKIIDSAMDEITKLTIFETIKGEEG